MRYFLSYKFTGVSLEKLHEAIDPIMELFKENDKDIFCNLYLLDEYEKKNFGTKEIMDHCFEEIDKSDIYIAYIDDAFAGGMAIECGYARAKNKKIVGIVPNNKNTFTTFKAIADELIFYEENNLSDMHAQLEKYLSTK